MANDLTIFNNPEFGSVRVLELEGEPWFVGTDVAVALGYSNATKAVQMHVDEEDKKTLDFKGFSQIGKSLWEGNDYSNKVVINESGIYALTFSSKLASAKRFKHWVTAEVLPSIRKRGIYATETTIDKIIADPDFGIRLLTELKEEKQKYNELSQRYTNLRCENINLTIETKVQRQQINELQPKATYYDDVLSCKEALPITVIAKDYGKSATWMNKFLKERGIQHEVSKVWVLNSKYASLGYTKTETITVPKKDGSLMPCVHTKWTQKGRLFIYELMKKNGFLPIVEQ